jgi:hypothetical protein
MPYGAFVKEIYLHAAEKEVSISYFTENGEWALLKAETVSGLIDEQFPTFVIVLELRRRPTFVIVNVILPILFMGLLNVLVFFLPASSGERVSFAMTVLLAIAVFLTLVGDNMPKTSQPMSTICYFLLTNLVLSSLIMIVTVLNLNLYHKGDTTTVPECISTFVRFVKCKRLPKRTKVENLPDTDDMEKNINANKAEKIKWAKARHTECVTWREVSEVVDVLFGWAAILWLFITAVSFLLWLLLTASLGLENNFVSCEIETANGKHYLYVIVKHRYVKDIITYEYNDNFD